MPSEKKKRVLPPPPGLDFTIQPKDNLVEDLRYALDHAKELFSDIAWEFTSALNPTTIYAHKAILYARSSRSFKERFLKNKDMNGQSIRSLRLSNPDPISMKTDADPFLFKQELKFFYTGEEGSEEFLAAVDTTDELEQQKLKEDLLYMYKSKLYTDVELVLELDEDSLEIIEEDDEDVFKPITIRAHRFILSTRSEYFKRMLISDFLEARTASISLDASIFNPTSINLILSFIYTGNLSYNQKPLTLEMCEWVWVGADFLNIKILCDEIIYRISTKLHYFTCVCGDCQMFVPRVASFAKRHVVENLWQGCLHALSNGFESMWPHKEFANLDEDIREEVLKELLDTIQSSNIVSVFKGCRKIYSEIDIKGIGLPWIETVRYMTNQVRSYAAQILVDNFEQLCEDQEFLDCVDGMGFSTDILEDIMAIIVEEGLTEKNSARVLKSITGKLLTRPAVMNAESVETKRVLIQAKQDVFNYIKKRWMGVKQFGGFRLLSPMLLDEFEKVGSRSSTNGLSKKASTPTVKTTSTVQVTPAIVTTPPPVATSTASTEDVAESNETTEAVSTVTTSTTSSKSTSSTASSSKPVRNTEKKGKSVRIGGATTAPAWDRPTRASVLRQKALAESSAKNPVKARTKAASTSKQPSVSSTNSATPKTTKITPSSKTTKTVRQSSSNSSLRVPAGGTSSPRGRPSDKQTPNSSRPSSISSTKSAASPSVSPSRFNGVKQTRASMLRQSKYDEAQQRRGRDRERYISPKSSRTSSVASASSNNSYTTTSSHHRRKRSPSINSTSTTITSASSGAITRLSPEPHQIKLATVPNPDISVGRRVILPTKNNAPGTIQFLGETEFAKGNWVGIELDNP
ncbi:15743_t:CDS:2, partial [Acaulospora colombiana]